MIQPALSPDCYTDPAWFNREQKQIFSKLWIFAALTQQLADENDFVTRSIGGTPVVLQRLKGELRAFRNTCAHRGMPIQTEECGNRKLICPYHGWGYAADGKLAGIPGIKLYDLSDDERETIKLPSFALHTVGNFVFVNLSPDPLPFAAQFSSDVVTVLEVLSQRFAPQVSYTKFVTNYNWKLNLENVLDWNHVPFVHDKSFGPQMDFTGRAESQQVEVQESTWFGEGGALQEVRFPGVPDIEGPIDLKTLSRLGHTRMSYIPRWYSRLFEESSDKGAMLTCVAFPNLNFGSVHGEHFYLQQYVPLSPDQTEFHSWVFTSRIKPELPFPPQLLWGMHHGEKRVIDEDIVLLERLQNNLKSASQVGIHGNYEAPLVAIGRWYKQNVLPEADQ